MKYFTLPIVLIGFLIFGCKDTGNKSYKIIEDKEKIKTLVINMYKWHDNANLDYDMEPIKDEKDSMYIGIDLEQHISRLELLRNTGYFSTEFIDNYDKIVRTIDKKLKTKEYKWHFGELEPFGDNAVAWCKSQDYPEDHPWDKIKFNFISIDSAKSTLTWTWGDSLNSKDFEYIVKVIKTNKNWKISYLQGFDFNEYTRKNY